MEGYRNSYPEERPSYSGQPDPDYQESAGWYADRGYREPERYEDSRPDPRGMDPAAARGPAPRPNPGPVPGPGTVPAQGVDPRVGRPPVAPGSPGPGGDGVYRSRRPATAVLVGVPAVLLELPALFLLQDAMFADPASAAGVVAASCLVLALPLLAIGLYAVATGAVRAAGPNSAQAWLRPPVAYLSVALVLLVSAGLAA